MLPSERPHDVTHGQKDSQTSCSLSCSHNTIKTVKRRHRPERRERLEPKTRPRVAFLKTLDWTLDSTQDQKTCGQSLFLLCRGHLLPFPPFPLPQKHLGCMKHSSAPNNASRRFTYSEWNSSCWRNSTAKWTAQRSVSEIHVQAVALWFTLRNWPQALLLSCCSLPCRQLHLLLKFKYQFSIVYLDSTRNPLGLFSLTLSYLFTSVFVTPQTPTAPLSNWQPTGRLCSKVSKGALI